MIEKQGHMKENYRALTRAYRPKTFEDIVSQEHVSSTLKNAIRNDRLSHAYMFCGPRGVGKTTMARVLAREVNQVADSVDGEELGRTLNIVEMDAASNRKIDDVRALKEVIRVPPQNGRYKIFIIDEVHMLTKEAFNALLKTLEEPPPHAIFIFATTEPHKVLPTILSRVQRFDFKRIGVDEIINRLKVICSRESITIDDESLHVIARRADGALRDALGLMDQAIAFCGDEITYGELLKALNIVDRNDLFTLIDIVRERDSGAGLTLIGELIQAGTDIQEFLVTLTEHIRNLYVALDLGRLHLVEATESTRERYVAQAGGFSEDDLIRMLHLVSDAQLRIRDARQPRIQFEILLLKLIHMSRSTELSELIEGLDQLKKNSGSESLTASVEPESTPSAEPGSSAARDQTSGLASASAESDRPTVPEESAEQAGSQGESDSPDVADASVGSEEKLDITDVSQLEETQDPSLDDESTDPERVPGDLNRPVGSFAASSIEPDKAVDATDSVSAAATPDRSDEPAGGDAVADAGGSDGGAVTPVESDESTGSEGSSDTTGSTDTIGADSSESSTDTIGPGSSGSSAETAGSDSPVDTSESEEDDEISLFGRPTLFVAGQNTGSGRQAVGTGEGATLSRNTDSVRSRSTDQSVVGESDAGSSQTTGHRAGNGRTSGINSVHDVKERWKELLKVLEESAPPTLYFQMLRVKVSDLDGRTLTVSVDNAFARQLVEENQEALGSCMKRVFGKRLKVVCNVVRNEREEAQRMSPYERFMELQKKDPNIRTLVDLFGAELEY